MEEAEEKETQKKEYSIFRLNWKDPKDRAKILLILVTIILSSSIMIISSKISYDAEISRSISDELIDNFESGFFMSFNNSVVGASKVKFGKWQGTLRGCGIMKDGVRQAYILEEGINCENGEYIEEIPSQDITSYKGLSLSASTKGKYYDLLYDGSIIKNGEKCPEGKKSCGYIDTLKNIYCIDKDAKCPISYIKIQSTPPTDNESLVSIKGTKTNLYYSNIPSSNPLDFPYIVNSFKIADSVLCALPNVYYSSISLHYLDAFINKFSKNCVLKDYSQKVTVDKLRYFPISEVDNYELYEENRILEKIRNSKIKDYGFNIEKYRNNILYLYGRAHFGFNKDCLDQMGFVPDHLFYMYGMADNMIVYGQASYLTILTIVSSFSNYFSFTSCFDCSKKYTSLETLIKFMINISSSLYLLIYSYYAIDYDDYYEKEMTCSDVITNNNYNIMIYKLRNNGYLISWTFGLYIALFIFILIYGIYLFILRENKKGWPCSNKTENDLLISEKERPMLPKEDGKQKSVQELSNLAKEVDKNKSEQSEPKSPEKDSENKSEKKDQNSNEKEGENKSDKKDPKSPEKDSENKSDKKDQNSNEKEGENKSGENENNDIE